MERTGERRARPRAKLLHRRQGVIMEMPEIPAGTGKHPVLLVAISANSMTESKAFYSRLFNWQPMPISAEITACVTPGGPTVSLRSNTPVGFQGMVPFIGVADVDKALQETVAAGATIERAPWNVPMVGKLARFTDGSGTVYGLTSALSPGEVPSVPMPFGSNPKPPAGSICSLEMFARDAGTTASFFTANFGWGTRETMPSYLAFNPGAGVGGTFQSHTPTMPAVAYVYVSDVRATLDEIDANGGKRMGDAMPVPGAGTFGYFIDPSGTRMGLIGP
jgi:predicted enzyme related to lactoylglutathione lyase